MCGIIGRFFKNAATRPDLTSEELSLLKHRGPDGAGVHTNAHLQFGHTRLAMIDLTSSGCQPMSYSGGRFVVTYNGEIYNYLELMSELIEKGERFTSHSDTEVLLASYKLWGVDCIKHFRGMFAFALWDDERKTLFLARDRCGEKPLFFHIDDVCFSFASELKGLIPLLKSSPKLDPSIVDMYLHYQYVPEPFTLLEGIQKLPAAHYLVLTPEDWKVDPIRYWDIEHPPDISGLPTDQSELLGNIRDSLEDAVKMTLRSDVPVGVALSGGIDSGMIAAFAQKHSSKPLHAFSVGYPGRPKYDERHQARELGERFGMIVHEVELPVESFLEFFPDLVRIMDEPIADPAAFGHYSVPKAASALGVKALLTGLGGDELFWGYSWVSRSVQINQDILLPDGNSLWNPMINSVWGQRIVTRLSNHPHIPRKIRNLVGSLKSDVDIHTPENQLKFCMVSPDFKDSFPLKKLVYGKSMEGLAQKNPFIPTEIGLRHGKEIPIAIMRLLFDTWLVSNCLTLGDRVSMAVGVETRLPFLDVRLIELVTAYRLQFPDHMLGQKAWLRSALKGVLPDEVLARPKAGFQPPTYEWLSGVVQCYGKVLDNGYLERFGILKNSSADFILNELSKQGWPGLFFVYKLVLLEMWYQGIVKS